MWSKRPLPQVLFDVLVVTGRNKNALANHFDHVTELEHMLEAKGDDNHLRMVNETTGLIEKPDPGTQPSNYAVIRRYVVCPEIFGILENTPPGKGGEIQLTDALETLAKDSSIAGGVYGVVFRGRRYDTGDRLDYIKAIVRLASEREDLGKDLRP